MNKIAVYGSLRKGCYNQSHFQRGMKHLGTTKVEGFQLYSLGAFPCAVPSEGELTVDLFEVDNTTKEQIDRMEIGAGYDLQTINIDGEQYTIYTYQKPPNDRLVEHGDWVKHLQNERISNF